MRAYLTNFSVKFGFAFCSPCYSVYKPSLLVLLLLLLLILPLSLLSLLLPLKILLFSLLLSLLLVFLFFFLLLLLLLLLILLYLFVIVFYFYCCYSYQVNITIVVSIISFVKFLIYTCSLLVNFRLSRFLLTKNYYSEIKRSKSVSDFCLCTLFLIFIYVTFILFLELK